MNASGRVAKIEVTVSELDEMLSVSTELDNIAIAEELSGATSSELDEISVEELLKIMPYS